MTKALIVYGGWEGHDPEGVSSLLANVLQENGVEVQRDTFFSRYQPWQAVYLMGTRVEE